MAALNKNGLIGGIRSTGLRRLAMVIVIPPLVTYAFLVPVIMLLPAAFAEAWHGFVDTYDEAGPGWRLVREGCKQAWSKSWTPTTEAA